MTILIKTIRKLPLDYFQSQRYHYNHNFSTWQPLLFSQSKQLHCEIQYIKLMSMTYRQYNKHLTHAGHLETCSRNKLLLLLQVIVSPCFRRQAIHLLQQLVFNSKLILYSNFKSKPRLFNILLALSIERCIIKTKTLH